MIFVVVRGKEAMECTEPGLDIGQGKDPYVGL